MFCHDQKWAVHLLFSALVLLGLSGGAAYSPQHAEGAARYDDILYFPASRYPETGAHISDAIKAGHSDVCTIERSGADKRRQESLKGIPTKPGFDRDEWPMAMCEEGAKERLSDMSAHRITAEPAPGSGTG